MSYRRLYVGRLPRDATEREVEHLCRDFGRIQEIHLMGGFAFVEYFDHRDARDCVRDLHDAKYSGTRLIVEPARNQPGDERIRDRDRDRDREYDRRGRPPPPAHHAHVRSRSPDVYIPERRKEGAYRIIVTGLPDSTSWQELKGVMRKAGEVVFADITQQGEGVVEFSKTKEAAEALMIFDNYDYKGHILQVQECHRAAAFERQRSQSSCRSISIPFTASSVDTGTHAFTSAPVAVAPPIIWRISQIDTTRGTGAAKAQVSWNAAGYAGKFKFFLDAAYGVDAIAHVASPVTFIAADPYRDVINPAVQGTLSVLRAAKATPSVKRVVLASSVVSMVQHASGHTYTEADWNDWASDVVKASGAEASGIVNIPRLKKRKLSARRGSSSRTKSQRLLCPRFTP
ncbi:serine arginine-rich splicing factor [Geranomyces variabilis]|nr:serine arginine-rich splicing factor [Geranomyces variabilis]